VFEWPDLDPRLGIRQLGGWGPTVEDDIVSTVASRLSVFGQAIVEAANESPLAIAMPSLPIPPVSHTPGWQSDKFGLEITNCIMATAQEWARCPKVRILNRERLDRLSPFDERLDLKATVLYDYPYKHPHASILAEMLVRLVAPPSPKKGLITDLDQTLWRGIVGEDGPDGISWSLDRHSLLHGVYQQMLGALADSGVMIAVASKNDYDLVRHAFERSDLILRPDQVYPLEVHWNAKSESIKRILQVWNIDAHSVIFVDDSPLELAEVQRAIPEIECLLFPSQDDTAIYNLLFKLRDLFGKEEVMEEDRIRLHSIRQTDLNRNRHAADLNSDDFLGQIDARLEISFDVTRPDLRAFELVNKTNQFNLNGHRFTEREWRSYLEEPGTFIVVASYQDKFGPLGKVAVLLGQSTPDKLSIDSWVLSCRAFSRRIEFGCLSSIFDRFAHDRVVLRYRPTERNSLLRDFLSGLIGEPPVGETILTRDQFRTHCPNLYFQYGDTNA